MLLLVTIVVLIASLVLNCVLIAAWMQLREKLSATRQQMEYYRDSSDRLRGHVAYLRGEEATSPIIKRARTMGYNLAH